MIRAVSISVARCTSRNIISRNIASTRALLEIVTINVPALGESITEGSIATWEKAVGDSVNVDDVITIVETDKVTVDIKSAFAGKLVEQLAEASSTVSILPRKLTSMTS
jgi:hypothetical protein